MTFFHGEGKRGPYFEGWYFKHQSPEGRTLALIPAFHVDAAGGAGASIQIIGWNIRILRSGRKRTVFRSGSGIRILEQME